MKGVCHMTNYTVDTTTIFEYRWDETPKYPLVRVLGYTVNPVVVTSTVNRDAKDGFTNRLSTLSRPPPKGGFSFSDACSPSKLPSTRRKYDRGDPRNFWSVKYCARILQTNSRNFVYFAQKKFSKNT